MAKTQITIKIKVPWWATYYIFSCKLFALIFGMQPDSDKIVNTIMRHTKVIQ